MASKEIPTPETLRQLLRYEPETGKVYWLPRPLVFCASDKIRRAFNTRWAGKEAGATDRYGYLRADVFGRPLLVHRLAWTLHYGEWPTGEIDHINGTPADNRITNLRDATHGENMRNSKRHGLNTSGEPGVIWDKESKRWRVVIRHDGKRVNLGRYRSFDHAVAARRKAAARLGFTTRHGT